MFFVRRFLIFEVFKVRLEGFLEGFGVVRG